jgi:hypothetical protein
MALADSSAKHMENEIENTISQNGEQEVEVTLDTTEETVETEETETVESLKQKNQELYEKLQKAKGKVRGDDGKWVQKPVIQAEKKAPVTETKVSMSNHDFLALVNAKIHEDDIVEVEDYAKFKGISIAEALKLSTVKTLLAEKEEMRKVANATNTGNARRSSTKPSSDTVLSNARSGKETDPEAVAEARMAERLKNRK